MADAYRIADEPAPGALAQFAVNPIWPLFAVMLAGGWLAWPWFVFNGLAVGSPSLKRECALVAAGVVGTALLIIVLLKIAITIVGADGAAQAVPYVRTGVIAWKLLVGYWLYTLQARTFGLYEYYGGTVRNGLLVVIAGTFLHGAVLDALVNSIGIFAWVLV